MQKLQHIFINLQNNVNRTVVRGLKTSPCKGNLCGWPKSDYGPVEVHRSSFMNGMKVAAAKPMGAQIASCTIMFSVGSRCEVDDELGVTHFLRAGSHFTGCSSSGFIKARYLQQKGGYITVNSDRQTISYTLRCPYYSFDELKCYLLDCGPRNFFYQHEINEIKRYVYEDLYRIPPEQRVMDLLQQACWTGGLANSVFCQKDRINDMTMETIDGFVNKYFQTMTCSIGAYGVPYDDVLKIASFVDCGVSERPKSMKIPKCSNFRSGYETFELGRGATTYIAMAVPSCGTCEFSTLLAYSILAQACGAGSNEPGGHEDHSPQTPLSLLASEDPYTEYKAFNISYWELGLFGILVKSRPETIRCAAARAAGFLANICGLDANTLEIGRRRLKVALYVNDDDCMKVSEGLAQQIANGVKLDSAKYFSSALDNVLCEDIYDVAKTIAHSASNMGVAVVGDLAKAPHDGELRRLAV